MSTWLSDLKKTNPKLAAAYAVTGNQDESSLRNMVKALKMFGGYMNSPEENERLKAAQYILRNKPKRKKNPVGAMHNIEKSGFHKNEYVGYAVGTVWKITRGGEGWRATARERYADSTYPGYLSARTLADLSVKLDGLYKAGGVNNMQDAKRARKENPALRGYFPNPVAGDNREIIEAATWVQNFLKSIEKTGKHAPTETQQVVIDYLKHENAGQKYFPNPDISKPHMQDIDDLAPMRYFAQMGKHGTWASVARFSVLTDAKDFAKKKSAGSSFSWRVFEKKPR